LLNPIGDSRLGGIGHQPELEVVRSGSDAALTKLTRDPWFRPRVDC
jgi:hypothetical protein